MGVHKSSGGAPNGPEGAQNFHQQGGAYGQRYATATASLIFWSDPFVIGSDKILIDCLHSAKLHDLLLAFQKSQCDPFSIMSYDIDKRDENPEWNRALACRQIK